MEMQKKNEKKRREGERMWMLLESPDDTSL